MDFSFILKILKVLNLNKSKTRLKLKICKMGLVHNKHVLKGGVLYGTKPKFTRAGKIVVAQIRCGISRIVS